MTASDALALMAGPRQEELEELLEEFFTTWGYTLAHHTRRQQFGALILWLESKGLAHLPGGPDTEKDTIAVGGH